MGRKTYRKIGSPENRLVEELAEVIVAIQKAERFGFYNHHPDRPGSSNLVEIVMEMEDVARTWNEVAKRLGLPFLKWTRGTP